MCADCLKTAFHADTFVEMGDNNFDKNQMYELHLDEKKGSHCVRFGNIGRMCE